MSKYILFILSVIALACGGPKGIIISDADKATFEKTIKPLKNII